MYKQSLINYPLLGGCISINIKGVGYMTLGLATCNTDGIYLAIESEGINELSPELQWQFNSKLVHINQEPEVVVLTAGGLEHWIEVVKNYKQEKSVDKVASQIVSLLNNCMSESNKAFGLVCGYNNETPECYRINRDLGQKETDEPVYEELESIQAIGMYPEEAINEAKILIENSFASDEALIKSIDKLIKSNCKDIKQPIQSYIISSQKEIA